MPLAPDRYPRVIVFLGGPASGKGTQAAKLASVLGVPHISSGELLRGRGATDPRMQCGELLPDELVTGIVLRRLEEPDAQRGAILDGFPRTSPQAQMLEDWLERRGGTLGPVIYLDVPRDVMIQRAAERGQVSHRSDDRPDVADNRVDVFLRELPPLLEHYDPRGVVRHIDGSGTVEQVHQQITAELGLPERPGR